MRNCRGGGVVRPGGDDYWDPDEEPDPDIDSEPQLQCPSCVVLLRIGETVCPLCGDDVTDDGSQAQDAEERRAERLQERG